MDDVAAWWTRLKAVVLGTPRTPSAPHSSLAPGAGSLPNSLVYGGGDQAGKSYPEAGHGWLAQSSCGYQRIAKGYLLRDTVQPPSSPGTQPSTATAAQSGLEAAGEDTILRKRTDWGQVAGSQHMGLDGGQAVDSSSAPSNEAAAGTGDQDSAEVAERIQRKTTNWAGDDGGHLTSTVSGADGGSAYTGVIANDREY